MCNIVIVFHHLLHPQNTQLVNSKHTHTHLKPVSKTFCEPEHSVGQEDITYQLIKYLTGNARLTKGGYRVHLNLQFHWIWHIDHDVYLCQTRHSCRIKLLFSPWFYQILGDIEFSHAAIETYEASVTHYIQLISLCIGQLDNLS